jgi:parallel beta-helix repeat protein
MRATILTIVLFLMAALPGQANTIEVPKDYTTIQEAIDHALNGDTVLVSPGTYAENIDFLGKGITLTSTDGPDATVIDGCNQGSVVKFVNDEKSNSVLEGFTLTNGSGTFDGYYGYLGGGIYCLKSSPTIKANRIEWNTTDIGGGIFYRNGASPLITNNKVFNNTAYKVGGGILAMGNCTGIISNNEISFNFGNASSGGIGLTGSCSPAIAGNVLEGNYAGGPGGGIYCHNHSSPAIENNLILCNEAVEAGGGISCWDTSEPEIVNNTLYRNIAGTYGGGICCRESSSPVVTNNTLLENQAYTGGGGLGCLSNSFPNVTNGIVRENTSPVGPEIHGQPVISHCNVKGGWTGTGNIDADPLFVDQAGGDFHLTFPSPCKDAGYNSASALPEVDFEGDPRIAHGCADMGADEFYTHLYSTGDATPGGNVELKFVGLPGTSPVGLCIGSGVLDPALKSMWGDWYLKFPIFGPFVVPASIPSTGALSFPGTIPAMPLAPYSIPMQALIGAELSNLSALEVQ